MDQTPDDGIVMSGGDATVYAPAAVAWQRAPAENILHHCPLCGGTFEWDAFRAHAPDCIAAHPEAVAAIKARV